MTWPHDEHSVLLGVCDEAVDMAEQEVQARSRPPVAYQTMLDIFACERLFHKRIAAKVNLTNGHVVGRAPVFVDAFKGVIRHRAIQLLPRSSNNRTCHKYSCTFALFSAVDYYCSETENCPVSLIMLREPFDFHSACSGAECCLFPGILEPAVINKVPGRPAKWYYSKVCVSSHNRQ